MSARMPARRALSALLALATLALQFALPALHPQHAATAFAVAHAESSGGDVVQRPGSAVAHDGPACPLCATIAQGRAGAVSASPDIAIGLALHAAPVSPATLLLATPALTRAAPRGPPALA